MERRPVIHWHGVCWNEADMLPRFLAHYRPFVDKFVILDDGSTDGSIDILSKERKVEFHLTNRPVDESYILYNTSMYNEEWKSSRGQCNWVIVGNIDEFVYNRDISAYLARCTAAGVTAVPALGFDMVRREPVKPGAQLLSAVRNGTQSQAMSRFAIFNPDAIEETNYGPGRHACEPEGKIVIPERDRTLNLHFKLIGFDETYRRMKQQDARRNKMEKDRGFGAQYGWPYEKFSTYWNNVERNCLDVLTWYKNDLPYVPRPWWRDPERGLEVRTL